MADVDFTDRTGADRTASDKPLPELVKQLTEDVSGLVSTQLELAKVEIKEEITKAGKGAGMLTGGALAAYLAVALLSWAAAWGLAEVMPTGWAFFFVGVVWAIVAAALVMAGRKQLSDVQPLPPKTKETIKEDIEWAKQQKT